MFNYSRLSYLILFLVWYMLCYKFEDVILSRGRSVLSVGRVLQRKKEIDDTRIIIRRYTLQYQFCLNIYEDSKEIRPNLSHIH